MMGEGVRELPSLKDDPKEIMEKLMAPLEEAREKARIRNNTLTSASVDNKDSVDLSKLQTSGKDLTVHKHFGVKESNKNNCEEKDAAFQAAEMLGLPTDSSGVLQQQFLMHPATKV